MKKSMALAFALTFSLVGAAAAQDKAAGEAKGTVRSVEVTKQAVILEDGTRLSVSDKQIDHIWAGDQVKAGYEVKGDKNVVTDLQVERFSAQEAE